MTVEIKTARCGKDFMATAKKYVANMEKNKKMLHIKGYKKCSWSKFLESYIDFDTLEEAEAFSPRISKCQRCFEDQ